MIIEYQIVRTDEQREDAEVVHLVLRVFHGTIKETIETQSPMSRDEARALINFLRDNS